MFDECRSNGGPNFFTSASLNVKLAQALMIKINDVEWKKSGYEPSGSLLNAIETKQLDKNNTYKIWLKKPVYSEKKKKWNACYEPHRQKRADS